MKQKYLILTGIVLSFFMLQSVVLSADLIVEIMILVVECILDYANT